MLPQELGCGSGMTCWRRLHDWQRAGVWEQIHLVLLDWLTCREGIDWSRAVLDACSVPAVFGGLQTGPNPTDRAKLGSKRHLICVGQGIPLAIRLTGAACNDPQKALALVDVIGPLQGPRVRPRCRPDCSLGDRAYDAEKIRVGLRAKGIQPLLAQRNTAHGSGLGSWRWGCGADVCMAQRVPPVLRVCYERRADKSPFRSMMGVESLKNWVVCRSPRGHVSAPTRLLHSSA
jgi:transposase